MRNLPAFALISTLTTIGCSAPLELQQNKENDVTGYTLYAHAMFAEPVYDRDVNALSKAFSNRLGSSRSTAKFGYTSNALKRPSPKNVNTAIAQVSTKARDGTDVVIVFLTTHGTESLLAVKSSANEKVVGVSADALNDFLKPAQNDQQIIILQACYSGSLIKGLKHPNRIIMTAAAADRTSFGCSPDSRNTWFTKAMVAAPSKSEQLERRVWKHKIQSFGIRGAARYSKVRSIKPSALCWSQHEERVDTRFLRICGELFR